MGLNSRALNDCETALKLNENSFKAAALKGKAYFQMGEEKKSEDWIETVKKTFPDRIKEIEGFNKRLKFFITVQKKIIAVNKTTYNRCFSFQSINVLGKLIAIKSKKCTQ